MPDTAPAEVLPLRPLTTGELLDSSVSLLRTRAGLLLASGTALALAEQVLLFPLRRAANLDATYLPDTGRFGPWLLMVAAGFVTEPLCIALLGGIASTAAPQALLGAAAPPSRRATGTVAVTALIVACCCAVAIVTVVAWPFAYGLFGLAIPAVVIDRLGPGRALLRSLRLASRGGWRGARIRLLGYLVWLVIRLSLSISVLAVIALFISSPNNTWDILLSSISWLVVNAMAYPVLSCLDATVHMETRMRTEGLDIALRRALRRGVRVDSALAVPPRATG